MENGEENFKLNTFCLTSFGLQNNSLQMHHHSCTMYTYSNTFYWVKKKVAPYYTTVKKKIMYLPQNCKLSGNLLELEFCMLHGSSQFPCVSLLLVSVSLQGPAFHHGKPAISIHFY